MWKTQVSFQDCGVCPWCTSAIGKGGNMVTNIVDLIPKGSANAISREDLLNRCIIFGIAFNDRAMRKAIEDARKSVTILNMQDGRGYFLPDKNDHDKLRHYINQEHDRSISILRNLKMANNLLSDYENNRI